MVVSQAINYSHTDSEVSNRILGFSMLKLKLNPEGQGRQPPTDQPQPPATSRSRQPPPRLQPPATFTLGKFEFLYFDFVYK